MWARLVTPYRSKGLDYNGRKPAGDVYSVADGIQANFIPLSEDQEDTEHRN